MTVRTTTHCYPQAELDAMTDFYGGKRCVISLKSNSVEWCHNLDAALQPCNTRLSRMLMRNLRQDRHPRHAAEVRENIVPLSADNHHVVDEQPSQATLFLHEDILGLTLAYERDLAQWRIAELEAGRTDPGRPEYEEVFGGGEVTRHRWHAACTSEPFIRFEGGQIRTFYPKDCPGIDDASSQDPFPIINTLLSIPFSLLHNLPRLSAIVPPTVYQQQLIAVGLEIISWWWWDPSPDLINESERIRFTNQREGARSAKPHPVFHHSRDGTTFSMVQTITTHGPQTIHSSNRDLSTFELPSGQILLGTIPSFSQDGDELLLTAGHEGLGEMGGVHADKEIVTGAMNLPVAYETWDIETIEGTETDDNIDAMEDIEEHPPTGLSSLEISSWCEQVAKSAPEPLPLIPGCFERGVIGGMSTNDVLMIKGLIDPVEYINFFDLSLISCHSTHTSQNTASL